MSLGDSIKARPSRVDTTLMLRRLLFSAMTIAAGLIAVVAVVRPSTGPPLANRGSAAVVRTVFDGDAGNAPRIVAFGDSLLHESRDDVATLTSEVGTAEWYTRPGSAPCDWNEELAVVAATPPDVVILEFSGNANTPCVRGAGGVALTATALADRYRADLTAAVDAFTTAGVRVLLVDAPRGRPGPPRGDQFDGPEPFTVPILQAIVRQATDDGSEVELVRAGRRVLTPTGAWTATLPCNEMDRNEGGCIDGRAEVRGPDGAHFCPLGWPDERGICPVWSPGAWRYASAIAEAVRSGT